MALNYINSKKAPQPIGPYSQAIENNGLIFLSGQIALDPQTGNIISQELEDQVHQVIRNLQSVLEEAGSGLDKVLKTTIFLKDMEHFTRVNTIYAEYFDDVRPARSTVEVSRLPKDVLVEIDCIAAK